MIEIALAAVFLLVLYIVIRAAVAHGVMDAVEELNQDNRRALLRSLVERAGGAEKPEEAGGTGA